MMLLCLVCTPGTNWGVGGLGVHGDAEGFRVVLRACSLLGVFAKCPRAGKGRHGQAMP